MKSYRIFRIVTQPDCFGFQRDLFWHKGKKVSVCLIILSYWYQQITSHCVIAKLYTAIICSDYSKPTRSMTFAVDWALKINYLSIYLSKVILFLSRTLREYFSSTLGVRIEWWQCVSHVTVSDRDTIRLFWLQIWLWWGFVVLCLWKWARARFNITIVARVYEKSTPTKKKKKSF